MQAVTDKQVMAYEGLIESLAWKYVGYSGAEFDDLRQEGMLATWLTLTRPGTQVAARIIEARMIDWCRFLRRLFNNDGLAYEVMLPFESYDASAV